VIAGLHRAGELTDSSVSEAYSSGACVHKNWNEDAGTQHNSGEALASWMCMCVSNAAITQH